MISNLNELPIGSGRVYIAQRSSPDEGPDEFYGYWEVDDSQGAPRQVEERGVPRSRPEPAIVSEPGFATAEAAIAWGRSRAAYVFVRTRGAPGVYYSAGERDPEPQPGRPPVPRWAGS
jgi:hypothetical protein